MFYCSKCGRAYPPAAYCPFCGNPSPAPGSFKQFHLPPGTEDKTHRDITSLILIGTAAFGAFATAYVILMFIVNLVSFLF